MERAKAESIIAFYNKLAEVLGVEDSNTLSELRQMIPIIINFTKTGNLQFVDNANIGFASAVNFLRQDGLDEGLYAYLDADAAEKSDELEIAKILVALMYEIRLAHPATFTTYCDKLNAGHNAELAEIIRYMDDRQSWTMWPNPMFNDSTDANKENQQAESSTPKNSAAPIPAFRTTVAKSRFRSPTRTAMLSRTFDLDRSRFYTAGKKMAASKTLSFSSDSPNKAPSPVASVINSPRGEEVTQMRQLKRTAAEQKEKLNKLGKERDGLDERCTEQRAIIDSLKEEVTSLQDRNARLRADTDHMARLENELFELRLTESDLQNELQQLKSSLNEAQAARKRMASEKDAAVQRYELKDVELTRVRTEYESVLRRELESEEALAHARKQLLDKEKKFAMDADNYQQKLRELQELLDHREKSWRVRLNEKNQELLDQVQLMNDIQMRQGTLAQQFGEEGQCRHDIVPASPDYASATLSPPALNSTYTKTPPLKSEVASRKPEVASQQRDKRVQIQSKIRQIFDEQEPEDVPFYQRCTGGIPDSILVGPC